MCSALGHRRSKCDQLLPPSILLQICAGNKHYVYVCADNIYEQIIYTLQIIYVQVIYTYILYTYTDNIYVQIIHVYRHLSLEVITKDYPKQSWILKDATYYIVVNQLPITLAKLHVIHV